MSIPSKDGHGHHHLLPDIRQTCGPVSHPAPGLKAPKGHGDAVLCSAEPAGPSGLKRGKMRLKLGIYGRALVAAARKHLLRLPDGVAAKCFYGFGINLGAHPRKVLGDPGDFEVSIRRIPSRLVSLDGVGEDLCSKVDELKDGGRDGQRAHGVHRRRYANVGTVG